jgi:hypothetical protein
VWRDMPGVGVTPWLKRNQLRSRLAGLFVTRYALLDKEML